MKEEKSIALPLAVSIIAISFSAIFVKLSSAPASILSMYRLWLASLLLLPLATVPTLSHLINNWLLNYVNATTISISILGEPVGAAILAFLLLHESLTGMQILGGLLVLAGVFFFLYCKKHKFPARSHST